MAMPINELNQRAQRLLNSLVAHYIEDGKPVGSQTLAEAAQFEVSSATVRNVMSELEQLGYVSSPHTSAGRVPTDRGYRFFVDALLHVEGLDSTVDQSIIENQVDLDGQDVPGLIDKVSSLLSSLTHLAGVVTLPRRDRLVLRQVEFLQVGKNRVLVILVTNEWEVQNKVIQTQNTFTSSELEQAANYINEHFAGKDLKQARTELLTELKDARESVNRMMLASLQIAERAFLNEEVKKEPLILRGQSTLLQWHEISDVDKMRRIFDAFSHKQRLLQLMDQCINAQGVQIFIGEESGFDDLQELSMVTSPYAADGQVVGVLGVIGPTRMHYEKVIPVVNVTARLLGAVLNQLK